MRYLLTFFALMLLAGCGETKTEAKYPTGADRASTGGDIYAEAPSIFGPEGLQFFGGRSKEKEVSTGIGVNGYLWRAALDTVSFMPLASADPFGGVILTNWYSPSGTPEERFKLNVLILDKQLRASAIDVKVFRQVKRGGGWQDAEALKETEIKFEDTILTRARQMRVAQLK